MPNPYTQAALTYYRHFRYAGRLWALIGIVILYLLCSVIFIFVPDWRWIYIVGLIFPLLCVAEHIKAQFQSANAHLIPDYRKVHVRVAVAAVLIFTVFLPLSLSLLARIYSFSLTACFTVIFSAFLWGYLGKRSFAFFPLLFIACFTETGRIFLKDFFSGGQELQAFALFTLGFASSLWGLFRLSHLTEEDPAYQKLQAVGLDTIATADKNVLPVPFVSKKWKERLLDRHIAQLANHARRGSVSGWSRIGRWQLGINPLFALLSCGVSTALMWITWYFIIPGKQTTFSMFACIAGIIPLSTLGGLQKIHRPSREILLPVSRVSYLRQMGTSAAIGLFFGWAISWSISVFLHMRLFQKTLQPDMLVDLSLISAFAQVLFFGVTLWMGRFRSKIWQILAILVPLYLQMALLATVEFSSGSYATAMVLIAAVATVVGLLITYDAYRRWLVADID